MVYFDTSFLAPLLLSEPTSAAVEDFVAGIAPGTLAVSQWTRVEFASLLARLVRMAELDRQTAAETGAAFEEMVQESFVVWLPDAADYQLARIFLGRAETGLRAGDALHLAVAANHGADAIYTLDRKLLRAGATFGLPASPGI